MRSNLVPWVVLAGDTVLPVSDAVGLISPALGSLKTEYIHLSSPAFEGTPKRAFPGVPSQMFHVGTRASLLPFARSGQPGRVQIHWIQLALGRAVNAVYSGPLFIS